MAFTAITANTPAGDAGHVYAEDDAALFEGIFGKDGVLNVGSKLAYERTEKANEIRIKDGVVVCGGHIGRNRYADYTDVTISNGAAGYKRNDIIVARFTRTGAYGTDTYTINVVSGTRTSGTPVDPAITQEDVYAAGNRRELPLYRVKLNGTSIEAIEQMFKIIPTIPEIVNIDTAIQTYEENSWRVSYYNVSPTEKYVRIERQFVNGLETRGFTTVISALPFSVKSCLLSGMVHTASAPVGHAWAKLEGNQVQISNGTYNQSMYITCFGIVKAEEG